MKLERIAQIAGLIAFISFIIAVWQLTKTNTTESLLIFFLSFSIIGVLSSILITLKRIARDLERK
jgi:uncharacterized membrane protein